MFASSSRSSILGLASALSLLLACGDDSGAGTGGSSSSGGAGGEAGGSSSSGGAGGGGPAAPTPDDVQFAPVNPLPSGELIVVNDWSAAPNEVLSMRADGSELTTIFRSFRVWSLAVSNDGGKVAFAAGDPKQVENYGIQIGDVIQPTFLYDVATQSAEVLSYGNQNDECHHFGPGDTHLYLCRRYDWDAEGNFKGYRIGRIALGTRAFEWLTDEDSKLFTLSPQPTNDGLDMFYQKVPIPGARSIVRRAIAGGAETVIRTSAGNPVLAPDGVTLLISDYTQQGSLVLVREGQPDVLVAQGPDLSNARFSPDGSRVVLLRWDSAHQCSHVEIAPVDGSQASEPERIYDCETQGRFISDVAWISR